MVEGKNFKQAVLQNASAKGGNELLNYRRGEIMDRNGIVVAQSVANYELFLDPKLLLELQNPKIVEDTIAFLQENLGYDPARLREAIEGNPNSHVYTLKKDYTLEEIKATKEAIDRRRLIGVEYIESYRRNYPYNDFASDVIGFVNADNRGANGIEGYYEDYLKGGIGRRFGVVEDGNTVTQQEVLPTNGNDVYLNVDYTIQKYMEDAIDRYLEEYTATNIQVIAMDPNNGKVLGMASYPRYDANKPYDLSAFFTLEEQKALTPEEQADFRFGLWNNWGITSTYEPGSTYKPFVSAIAYEEGREKDGLYHCSGSAVVNGQRISCWKKEGHGAQTIEQILANSCNVGYMELGSLIGKDLYYNYQRLFGFGSVTNIDLLGETSARTLLHSYERLNTIELATGSFGQGFNITPIQLVSGFASLVNGGYLYEPHVVDRVVSPSGEVVLVNEPRMVRQVVSKETSREVVQALKGVVDEGTGQRAYIEGYEIGGKTATAEKLARDNINYVVSFIGFAPVENPQVITLVVVDEPRGPRIDSRYAAFIFKDVMEQMLPYLRVFKTDAVQPPEPLPQEAVEGVRETQQDPAGESPPEQEAATESTVEEGQE
nr:penicillin-binding protein 2 [Anaerotalea alkaliphila]